MNINDDENNNDIMTNNDENNVMRINNNDENNNNMNNTNNDNNLFNNDENITMNVYNFGYIKPIHIEIKKIEYTDPNKLINASFATPYILEDKKLPITIKQMEFDSRQIYEQSYMISTKQQQNEQNRDKLKEISQLEQCKQYIEILKNMIGKARQQHEIQSKKIANLEQKCKQLATKI